MGQGHEYQCWAHGRGGNSGPSGGGAHGDRGRQVPAKPGGTTVRLAVEPAGGSQAPTTDPVMVLVG